jgi:D-3-phosphoglycerate dehydrogenase
MKYKVLVSAPYIQTSIARFRDIFEKNDIEVLLPPVRERLTGRELIHWVKDVDGVICGDDQFTERVLKAATRLKVISKWGTGTDSIDLNTCNRLGILVYSTLGAFTDAVADTVMGYILAFARKLFWMDRDIRSGSWKKHKCISLCECVLGVIGVGNIGKAVVRRAIAFKMRVLGNDIVKIPQKFISETGIEMLSKNELLRQSDFISLNCDLNPTSYHLIDEQEFSIMKSTAYIINPARGAVINESALVNALKEKRISGSALDVFEVEPLPTNSPLREMNNVLLSPHNANSSPRAWERVHQNTINNLLEGLREKR